MQVYPEKVGENMTIQLYSGNTTTLLGTYNNVNTVTMNKDGSISFTDDLSNPDGRRIYNFGPHGNKIVITRNYNE